MMMSGIVLFFTLISLNVRWSHGFVTQQITARRSSSTASTFLSSTPPPPSSSSPRGPSSYKKKTKHITLGELQKELQQNPQQFQAAAIKRRSGGSRRTRQRVEQPKQTYLYKAQRDRQQQQNQESLTDNADADTTTTTSPPPTIDTNIRLATELGLKASAQHCDPTDTAVEPVLLGRIRVADGETSASYAYLLQKPAGWAILGGKETSSSSHSKTNGTVMAAGANGELSSSKPLDRNKFKRQVKAKNNDGSTEVFEFNELDVLALLTPEEREEYIEQYQDLKELRNHQHPVTVENGPMSLDDDDVVDEEFHDVECETDTSSLSDSARDLTPETAENLKRIAARAASNSGNAKFADAAKRPSLVAWLKDYKQKHQDDGSNSNIRGGNFWVALAGATEVDDTGVVLLCPRAAAAQKALCVEFVEYVAVVGNGGHLQSVTTSTNATYDGLTVDVIGKLKMGRLEDVVQAVKVEVPEIMTTCSDVVGICQKQFRDGVRGDVASSPLERRAWRRLVHCSRIFLSSLDFDEHVLAEATTLPDDVVPVTNRRPNRKYSSGSWLGRSELRQNPLTTAYREINGAADGFPGWTVDRYDRWLFVQHDPAFPRGPLPSIHDGSTAGVYYLEASQDRNAMGSADIRPILLEGQAAPDGLLPVLENGIKYLVSLDKDLSTGIFLDQRASRAWLARNCCSDTKILNCLAHTGAFSVAAASAGASTVSIDLSKKWLDRLPMQLEANGILFDERHDCINGDCFDWLAKLAKRGEKYDVVILDPPSTSVGGSSKKRWSVANDMDTLVALASRLVKKGGMLWTTTNSARIPANKFARLCKRGLDEAGIEAKLERIQPMPLDFPSLGAQPVKNLIWRIGTTRTK